MSNDSESVVDNNSSLLPLFFQLGQKIASAEADQPCTISEQYFDERLYAAEYINIDAIPEFSLARCRVEPGVTTQLHHLSVNEWYVVESGEGRMELDSVEEDVAAGAIVQIPKGVNQRITNTGGEDLIFFCVCLPRFTPEVYSTDE